MFDFFVSEGVGLENHNTHFDDRFIEEVKNANDIVEIISKYVDLKRAGDSYKGLCPFHNEKTPSFMVSENKQIFKCFGCGEGGNVITFLMKKENIGFFEAIKLLCENARIELPVNNISSEENLKNYEKKQRMYDLHIELARYYFDNMQKNIENSMDYLKNRGIDEKTVRKFGLGYEVRKSSAIEYLYNHGYTKQELLDSMIFRQKNDELYSIFFSRVMYPIFDYRNRVVAFGGRITGSGEPKYLNSPESIIFKKKEQLYGLNLVRKYNAKRIILVEGYMDVIRLNQKGIVGAVASLGTSLTKEQSEIIKKQNKKVYICYDSDKAGRVATVRAIDILQSSNIKPYIISLEGYKDPDEFFNKNKTSDFMAKIENAVSPLSFLIDNIKSEYNINIYSQKLEFIDKASELIKSSNDAIEMEYQTKRLAEITNMSVKSIGVKVYGQYFSPKQFQLNQKSDEKIVKKVFPHIENSDTQTNEKKLIDIISKKPDCIRYIMDILNMDDITDDSFREHYSKFLGSNGADLEPKNEEYKILRKLALFTKIDILQKKLKKLEQSQNMDVEEISFIMEEKIKIIKLISNLKEDIKGLI